MNTLITTAIELLDSEEWNFKVHTRDSGDEYIKVGWSGDNTRFDLVIDATPAKAVLNAATNSMAVMTEIDGYLCPVYFLLA